MQSKSIHLLRALETLIALLSHLLHLSLSKHFTDRVRHHIRSSLARILLLESLILDLLFNFWASALLLLWLLQLGLL